MMMSSAGAAGVSPPIAKRVAHTVVFGKVAGEKRGTNPMEPVELQDDLFWIRDDTRKNEEVLQLLREENDYSQHVTANLEGFRGDLYNEMLSHVLEDDDTYPSPAPDGFEYWSRTIKGKSFRVYLRRPRGSGAGEQEQTILDVNEVASLPYFQKEEGWDAAQCDVREVETSPSGKLLAYAVDGSGYETYNIRLKDLTTGAEMTEEIRDTGGSVAWADETTFFYVKQDAQHRPFQVWRHVVGSAQAEDVKVFEDLDDLFNVGCATSRDGSLLFIESESKETTEISFVPAATPAAAPTLIRPRQYGVRYDVDSHAPSRQLYLTSNADGLVNRQLYAASLDAPAAWTPLSSGAAPVLAHSDTRSIDHVSAFETFLAVGGREEGFTQVWVLPLDGAGGAAADAQRLGFEDASFTAELATNMLFEAAGKLRLQYSSMVSPRALREYEVALPGHSFATLKVQPVPGYDASLYQTKRIEVAARDGEAVPVTLLWRTDAVEEGQPAPCHLYGYGSYGICMDPYFSASRLALVDRGVVFAVAHVRGGGEMGHHRWYEAAGKYLAKRNTFTDFVDCAEALVASGVAKPGALSCEGRSAGGLLVGNVVNMAPDMFCACIGGVPFVDLMVTMCDPSIPLTTEEWEEWGNPNEEKYYEYMMSYSPIDNVREGVAYPKMLIVSGLNDPRVAYWEPTKWAQVLRAKVTNGDEVLLKMDLAAGHFSAADRYRYLRELAFDYAWLLEALGKADAAPQVPEVTVGGWGR